MPESKKLIVLGGGLSGLVAAYWCKRQDPASAVSLLEKQPVLLSWTRRATSASLCLGRAVGESVLEADYPRGLPWIQPALERWSGNSTHDWLTSHDLPLRIKESGLLVAEDPAAFADSLEGVIREYGVEIAKSFAAESISRQSDGSYRIWSRDGQQATGNKVLVATGGERNHGLALARELGARENPVLPAYLRLRLASPKLAGLLGNIHQEVRLRCPRTGQHETGEVRLSPRGLEGNALSRLGSRFCEDWKQRDYRLKLEVDWLPSLKPSTVRSELDSRCLTGRKKAIGEEPLFSLGGQQWIGSLQLARIDPSTPWLRLKKRQLQSLVQRLKGDSLSFSGMGLPAGERAWAGGIDPDEIDWITGASRSVRGIYYAGEILDVLGMPGGPHLNLVFASAYLTGSAMALDE